MSKRPGAADLWPAAPEPKRNRPDDRNSEQGNASPTLLSRGNFHPESDAYSRRDYHERRNSEQNIFIAPGGTSISRKASLQSPLSPNESIKPTGGKTQMPPSSPKTKSTLNNEYVIRPSATSSSLDPRKRPTVSSNLQALQENTTGPNNTSMTSSATSPEQLLPLLSEAKTKQEKARQELERLHKKLEKVKNILGSNGSTAIVKIENDFAQASSAVQAADLEVNRIEKAIRDHEIPEPVNQDVIDQEAIQESGCSSLEPMAAVLPNDTATITRQQEDVAELRRQLDTLKAQRQKEVRENTERDRQIAIMQEDMYKFFATQAAEKQVREEEQKQREKDLEEKFRIKLETSYIDTQRWQKDVEENLRRERELVQQQYKSQCGQIPGVLINLVNMKKDNKDLKSDMNHLEKDVNRLKSEMEYVNDWVRTKTIDILHINHDLSSITKAVNSIQNQVEQPRVQTDAAPSPDPSVIARLDVLEAFQKTATHAMNIMSTGLKGVTRPDDLDVLQESLTNVAYDTAKEEAREVFNNLTARINTMENRVVPGEDVKTRLTLCEADLNKVVKWVGQRPEDDPDLETLTGIVATLKKDIDGTPLLPDDHEDKVEGITEIVARCEEAVGNLSTRVEEMAAEKSKPEQRSESDGNIREEIDDRTSSLKSHLETQRVVFETQMKSSYNSLDAIVNNLKVVVDSTLTDLETKAKNLETNVNNLEIVVGSTLNDLERSVKGMITSFQSSKDELGSQLPPLQEELERERAARADMEKRLRNNFQTHVNTGIMPLRGEFEVHKQNFSLWHKHVSEQMVHMSGQIQEVNAASIQTQIQDVSDRCRVAQTGLQNLEGRYNAITTTSIVQMMLDQVHRLVPPGKDLLSIVKEVSRHGEQIRQLSQVVDEMPNKLALNNKGNMDDIASFNQAVATLKKTLDAVEVRQNAILEKLSGLQHQLELDDDALISETTLRGLMEGSIRDLREHIRQLIAGQEQSKGPSHQDFGLVKSNLDDLNKQIISLGEASKAPKVPPFDATKFAKKTHVDELKDTVLKLGSRMDKVDTMVQAKSASAATNEDDDDEEDVPLVARRSNFVPMGKYAVSPGTPKRKPPTNSRRGLRRSIADSEEERSER